MKKKYYFVLLNYETDFTHNNYCHSVAIFGNCLLGNIITALYGKTLLQIYGKG